MFGFGKEARIAKLEVAQLKYKQQLQFLATILNKTKEKVDLMAKTQAETLDELNQLSSAVDTEVLARQGDEDAIKTQLEQLGTDATALAALQAQVAALQSASAPDTQPVFDAVAAILAKLPGATPPAEVQPAPVGTATP